MGTSSTPCDVLLSSNTFVGGLHQMPEAVSVLSGFTLRQASCAAQAAVVCGLSTSPHCFQKTVHYMCSMVYHLPMLKCCAIHGTLDPVVAPTQCTLAGPRTAAGSCWSHWHQKAEQALGAKMLQYCKWYPPIANHHITSAGHSHNLPSSDEIATSLCVWELVLTNSDHNKIKRPKF